MYISITYFVNFRQYSSFILFYETQVIHPYLSPPTLYLSNLSGFVIYFYIIEVYTIYILFCKLHTSSHGLVVSLLWRWSEIH